MGRGSTKRRVVSRDEAAARCARWRAGGQVVVLTNGCFDLLHVGHVRYLQQARRLGRLVVAINSDTSTRQIKGPTRPILPESERAEILAALRCVDLVTIFDEPTAEQTLVAIRPTIYVKGTDYGPAGRALPEALVAERLGTRVVLLPLVEGRSTTGLIETIRQRYS